MNKTHSREELEGQLRGLNERIKYADEAASQLKQAADGRVAYWEARGKHPVKDREAFEDVDKHYAEADEAAGRAGDLRAEREGIMATMAGLQGDVDRGTIGRPGHAPFGLTGGDVRELFAAAQAGRHARVGLGMSALGTADFPPATQLSYDREVLAYLRERTRIADHLPIQLADTPQVVFFRATGAADAAAAVAEGADKPESTPEWEQLIAEAVKVAHYGRVNDEILKDFASWQEVIGSEFIAGLIDEENAQILSGDGTGANMTGILETSGILSIDRDSTESEPKIEALARAITALRTGAAFTDATLTVLHPNDYLDIALEKGTDGQYLAGDPRSAQPTAFWNVPVVTTTAIPEGVGLVGNFALGAKLVVREAPIFEVHPGGGGEAEWKANKTLVRAEERLVVVVTRPAAFCEVLLA